MLIHWATLPTLAMFPILMGVNLHLDSIFTIRFTHPAIFDNHNLDNYSSQLATYPSLLDGKKAVLFWTILDLGITL